MLLMLILTRKHRRHRYASSSSVWKCNV